ncbi:MAG: hypothetical protein KTU85_10275 [Acidimicrobiia bacterium]|nr:hypothetical protein [Acidimicrobiia bacterium]
METTVITTIISVMGITIITMLGYFMQSVRADMQNIRNDMQNIRNDMQNIRNDMRLLGERIDRLDEKVNVLTASVASIAATQIEHGKKLSEHSIKLDQLINLGERVSAVEGAVFNKPVPKLALAASIEPDE